MSSDLIKDKAAIVGLGETAFGKGFEQSEEHLACQAIKMAPSPARSAPQFPANWPRVEFRARSSQPRIVAASRQGRSPTRVDLALMSGISHRQDSARHTS